LSTGGYQARAAMARSVAHASGLLCGLDRKRDACAKKAGTQNLGTTEPGVALSGILPGCFASFFSYSSVCLGIACYFASAEAGGVYLSCLLAHAMKCFMFERSS
jgi:hypothetical protein